MPRLTWALVLAWLLSWLTLPTATADPVICNETDPWSGQCVLIVMPPPPDYPPPSGGGGGGEGGTGPAVCWDWISESEVACVVGGWYWSASWVCYTQYTAPQPLWGDPVWGGRTDGAIYDCARGITLTDPLPDELIQRWSAVPPWGAPPDPRDLALEAVEAMNLRAFDIGIVPHDAPGFVGIIGLPTYMWVEDEGPSTWGSITRTATSGPYSVTATGQVDHVVWDMGDGTTLTCTTPGTPYQEVFQDQPSPDCGHTYEEAGRYTVTATSYWVITWAGMGQSGTIEMDFTANTQIAMGEMQVISQ